MKQLYLRQGNSKETQDILIIGEESELGGRDNAYKPNKGTIFNPLKKDPYTGAKNLTFIHVTPNIKLDTLAYSRDYDVHRFIKEYCKDLVAWDGERGEGLVNSREAFIIKGNIEKTIKELYYRIEDEVHGHHSYIHKKKLKKFLFGVFLFPFRILISIFIIILCKKRRIKKWLKKIWWY